MPRMFLPLIVFASICLNVLAPSNAFGQASSSPSPKRLEFEAASVKPSASDRPLGTTLRDGKLTATGISVKSLIALAYDVRDVETLGGPPWIGSERYDISAKAAGPASTSELKRMARALLEDRFQLRTHRETKEMAVYALVAVKSGAKLKASNDQNCTDPSVYTPPPQLSATGEPLKPVSIRCGNFFVWNDWMQGRKVSLRQLASTLTSMNIVEQRVVDQTGIAGTYDIDLKWDPSGNANSNLSSSGLPSILGAFEEQLGLRLQPQKAPVEVLVIDAAMKASAN